MSNFERYLGVGPVIWAFVSLTAVGLMVEQMHRFNKKRPLRYQPVQGVRYTVLGEHAPSPRSQLILPLWIHWISSIGIFISLLFLAWSTDGVTDTTYYLWDDRMQLPLRAHMLPDDQSKMVFDGDALTVVASNWTTLFFGFVVLLLNLAQIGCLRNLRSDLHPAEMTAIQNAHTPSLWARTFLLLVLHYSMVLLYGIGVCAWGRFIPDRGFYTLVVLAFLSRAQYYVIADYIESLPPPYPGGVMGFPQCIPSGFRHAPIPEGAAAAGGVEMNAIIMQGQQAAPYLADLLVPRSQVNIRAAAAPAAPYYPPAYAVPVAMRVSGPAASAPIENAPLLPHPVQVKGASVGPRVCMNCSSIASGASAFCTVCGTRL